MKIAVMMMLFLFFSCDKADACWERIARFSDKTKMLHQMDNIALNEKLTKVRVWQDSLIYYKGEMDTECNGIEFYGKLMYNLDKVIAENTDFIRTHEKINE